MSAYSIIGRPLPMTDSPAKVSGLGRYADDISVPGMLVGKILHSPVPHARIKKIDSSKAEGLPEEKALATGRDAQRPYGILPIGHDENALATDEVRYIGENVAAGGAPTEGAAARALEPVHVEHEPLPAWLRPL